VAGAASSVLVTSAGSVPSLSTDLPTAVTIGTAYIYRVGGTDVAVADGGTGKSSYAVGDVVYASGTTTLAGLADVATGQVLTSGGVGAAPAYTDSPTLATVSLTNLTVANGGSVRTGTTTGNTLLIQAYDTDTGPAYVTLLTATAGTTPTLTLAASVGLTVGDGAPSSTTSKLYNSGGTLYWNGGALATGGIPTQITVANEAADTACFPLFATAATGDLGPKANTSLTFNAATALLTSTNVADSAGTLATVRAGGIGMTNQAEYDLVYASSATQLARIANAANGLLTTNSSKVPSLVNKLIVVPTVVTLTDGATPALDASLGNVFYLDAAGDRTIAVPSNATAGQKIVIIHYANGGARTLALNTGANGFAFGSDITALTATASGKVDVIGCIWHATISKWMVVGTAKGYA